VQLFSNNSKGTVGTALTNVATSLVLTTGHGARFPAVAGGDFFLATLSDGTNIEIVKVTAHTANSDTLTIARAQESIANVAAAAFAFAVGSKFEMRLTDGSFSAAVDAPFAVQSADVPFAAGRAGMFARSWAGRALPSWDPATGNPTKLQTNIYSNQFQLIKPNTGSTALVVMGGGAKTEGGTLSHPVLATTNFMTKQQRAQWTNVVTTTNQFLGMRMTDLRCFRGSAAGEGGFFFFCRFAFPLFPASTRVFIGLASLTTGVHVTADPSGAAAHHIGIAMDAADTNLTIMAKDGTTNVKNAIGAGMARAANETYDLFIFAKQNSANIGVRLDKWSSTGVNSNLLDTTYSTNIPGATTFLAPTVAMSNGTVNTTAATVTLALMSMYLETDN
jgi:hypothetical protein